MSQNEPSTWILLPRDGLSFRDGSGWGNQTAGRGRSLPWPFPTTVLGTLRSAVGRRYETANLTGQPLLPANWEQTVARVTLGGFLPVRRKLTDSAWQVEDHRLWPMPADAVYLEDQPKVFPLLPRPPYVPSLGRDDNDPLRERLWRPCPEPHAKPLPAPPWWTEADFANWLLGQPVAAHLQADRGSLSMPSRTEIHLTVDPDTLSYKEGHLFAADCRETLVKDGGTCWEWGIALQGRIPAPLPDLGSEPLLLGGKGRLAFVEPQKTDWFAMPKKMADNLNAQSWPGLRLVTITPAWFRQGWPPDLFRSTPLGYLGSLPGVSGEVQLRAALVNRPLALSGWNLVTNRPKAVRRLVPLGSVYFFTKQYNTPFSEREIHSLWFSVLGQGGAAGFGRVVPGCWDPAIVQG